MIIDHFTLSVADYEKSKAFYEKALEPLGISCVMEGGGHAGLGKGDNPEFWIVADRTPQTTMHFAFRAESRKEVDAFYKAAMEAGARDNGGPGLRPQYHPHYYGAFVIDINGHNLEAVCHKPE